MKMIFLLFTVLATANNWFKEPILPIESLKGEIAIRITSCTWLMKDIGNGEYVTKWHCPWDE